ncbi:MAG TPA: xanthine dehydrogenase family protein molybdopterin-binding subunit [Gaiellaceae bacterium]|nr:xanthine dehydrogenase family protein molybdopterin-binding subunit [Gaiellaceae bacterium]
MSRPFRHVGRSLPRVEDPELLRGRARFLDDVRLPGQLDVAFVRSPYAHARIVDVRADAAGGHDGVALVVTGADLGDAPEIVTTSARPEAGTWRRPLLARDRVRYVGEPVAAVVASSRYAAEDACELVEVDYEPLDAVVDPEQALEPGAPLLHETNGSNNFAHIEFERGDVDKAFERAAHVVAKRFHFGRTHAAPLEGRGGIADWSRDLTLWSSTQMPFLVRSMLAALYELPQTRVRVLVPGVGGGFGLKVHLYVEEAILPLLSRLAGAPVKWHEDRYEHLAASGHSKEVVCKLELALDEDGTFLALRGHLIGDGGAHQGHPWTSLIDPLCAASMLPGIYDVPAIRYEVDAAATNKCPSTAYRGVGWTSGHAAREVLIDDAARLLGVDPLELRLRNCLPDGEPAVSATGCRYDGGSYAESIRRARDLVGYEAFRERQARLREEGRYVGVGFSPFVEQGGWASQVAADMGFPNAGYLDSVCVTVEPDGSVTLTTGLQSNGQGHATVLAQLAADGLGVLPENVRVVQGDTATGAYSTGSWGSRTAVIAGGSVLRATEDVRQKLLQIAANELEASVDDLELEDGTVAVRGSPHRRLAVAEVAAAAYAGRAPEGVDPALTATRSYDPPATYSNACIACVVEVDAETGRVTVERIVAVEDCGTVLNPLLVDGQVAGAIAQGVGAVLYEGLPYADDGQFLAGSLSEFLYPTAPELPDVEVEHLVTPSPVTEGGIKGMGEGGLIGAPAAVVNAIADALAPFGVSLDRTPLRPCDVLAAVDAAGSRVSVGT